MPLIAQGNPCLKRHLVRVEVGIYSLEDRGVFEMHNTVGENPIDSYKGLSLTHTHTFASLYY